MIEQIKQLLAQVSGGDKSKAALILSSLGYTKWGEIESLDDTGKKLLLRELQKKYSSDYVTREYDGYQVRVPNKPTTQYGAGDIGFWFQGFDKFIK